MKKMLAPALAALGLALPGAGPGPGEDRVHQLHHRPRGAHRREPHERRQHGRRGPQEEGHRTSSSSSRTTPASRRSSMSAMEQLATGDDVAAVVGPYTSADGERGRQARGAVQGARRSSRPPPRRRSRGRATTTCSGSTPRRTSTPQSLLDAALALGKPKTIAFIYENTDFGISVATAGKEYAEKKGLKIVGDEAYQKGAPDYRSTLTKIKAQNPDLVFMVSYVADAILLMRQSREMGLKPQAFLGGGAGLRHRAVREREGHLQRRLLGHPVDAGDVHGRARRSSRRATRRSSARSRPTTRPAPTRR